MYNYDNGEGVKMNKAFNKVIKSHVTLTVLTVFAVVLLSGGITYSLFYLENRNEKNQSIAVGTLDGNITSITGAMVLNDLYPEKAAEITNDTKKYEFTISNNGTYDISYKIYLKDATDALLSSTTEYAKYKRIDTAYYKYINFKLDGTEAKNLASVNTSGNFALFEGELKAGASENHYLQFFLDNRDTTAEGAPNDISGSIISLDIYMDGAAVEIELTSKDTLNSLKATAKVGNPNFAEPATTDEGIYALEDDYGTSYYYRGASQNNYIKYGKNKDGQDMYWRIVRINGDGSLRIIYDGTQAYVNGTDNDSRYAKVGQVWNTQYNDAKYVGYMFGGANGVASTSKAGAQTNDTNSEAKTAVDTWYKENIVDTGYGSNVVDAIFCNDRSTPGKETTYWTFDTGLGYGTNVTAYGAYARLGVQSSNPNNGNPQPKFTCEVKNDAFTANESDKGNGKMTYPVGLITADEIMTAGGKPGVANQSYYLYKSSSYHDWSLSPYNMSAIGDALVFVVYGNGNFNDTSTNNPDGAIAPVINLSAEYASTLTGDGSMTNPYRAPGVEV